MDVEATQDQRILLDATTKFAEQNYPLTRLREGAFADDAVAAQYRQGGAGLGWFAMLVPEELGGGSVSSNGLRDAALIAYKRGQLLQPGAFVSTNVAAYAVSTAGDEKQQAEVLEDLVSGVHSAAWAIGAAGLHGPEGGTITATPKGDGYVLSGSATYIADVEPGAWLLVTAEEGDALTQFIISSDTLGVKVHALKSLDISRRFSKIVFEQVGVTAASVLGEARNASYQVNRQISIAAVLTACEAVGAMDHDFEMANQYAKDRIAFGRPIGSFQGIKHQLADASVLVEMSKGIALAAATTLGEMDDYGLQAASMAKSFVGDHGVDVAQTCFQIYGGIGFTWEHDQHLYLRRLTSDAVIFGDADWHREHLLQLAGI